jgi:hypothetical protein
MKLRDQLSDREICWRTVLAKKHGQEVAQDSRRYKPQVPTKDGRWQANAV